MGIGWSLPSRAQLGSPCVMDEQCGDPGLVCVADPSDPTEGICQEGSATTPGSTASCYMTATKLCSQSENDIASCAAGQKFPSPQSCEEYRQIQIQRESNESVNTASNCATGQDCVSLVNPLGETDIKIILGNTVKVVVGIIGTIAFVVFVYGGFQWLTSAGNSEKIAKGMQAMLWAGIGIIVVFSSYAILTLILQTLQAAP